MVEWDQRPKAIQDTKEAIRNFKSVINSTEEKYDHIDESERIKVRDFNKETTEWLDHQMSGQDKLGKPEDPVVTCGMIKEQLEKLNRIGLLVITKRRPPPKKPEPNKSQEESVLP